MQIEFEPNETPRQRAESNAQRERKFLKGQENSLRNFFEENGIQEVEIQNGTEIRDAAFFADRMTKGYALPFHEESGIITVASSVTDHPVSAVFIAPTKDTSGLLVDDTTGSVHTDSFWIAEKDKDGKNVLKHIKPSKPIPLDDLSHYTPKKEIDPVLKELGTKIEEKFDNVIDDKEQTKSILREAGIRVPKGIKIEDLADYEKVDKQIAAFLEDIDHDQEIVIKPNSETANGKLVVMGHVSNPEFREKAREYLHEMKKKGYSALLEERIEPQPQPALAKKYNDHLDKADSEGEKYLAKPEDFDYNFRVLTTIGCNPEVIDDEIRFNWKSEKPVNVSLEESNAAAIRTDILQNPDLVSKVRATATRAVSVVYNSVHEKGDPLSIADRVGVDVILDQDGNPHVIELQSGPGGFGTLASLDKKPLTSIAEVFVPGQIPLLQERFARRTEVEPKNLRRLATNRDGKWVQFHSYRKVEEYAAAEEKLYELIAAHPTDDVDEVEARLSWIKNVVKETKNHTRAVALVNEFVRKDPENTVYKEYRKHFENAEEYKQAEAITKKYLNGEVLTLPDLRFLYEVDKPQQFIYTSLEEIKEKRDKKADGAQIFGCREDQIAFNRYRVDDETIALFDAIYLDYEDILPQNLRYSGGGLHIFATCSSTNLRNLETVVGDANFASLDISDIGRLKIIGGYADFRYSQITDVSNLQFIGGNVYLSENMSQDMRNHLKIITRGNVIS